MENLDSWKPGGSAYKIWIEVLIGEKLFGDQVSKEKSGSGLYSVGFSIRIYFLIIVVMDGLATASTKSYQPQLHYFGATLVRKAKSNDSLQIFGCEN